MLQPDILCVYDATICYDRAFAVRWDYPLKFARKISHLLFNALYLCKL